MRLSQFLLWPSLGAHLHTLQRSGNTPIASLAGQYISLWNGVWLVANDIILGRTAGILLCESHERIGQVLSEWTHRFTIVQLGALLVWLGDWPAGLKLNTELSLFFGDMYQGLTDVWARGIISRILPHLPFLIYLIGLAGQLGGLTILLALSSDLLSALTFHITLFHLLASALLRFFTRAMGALSNLFRGKSRNPLRGGRIDDARYDLDQRLLGTMLFTLVAFLFPTVLAYHLLFATARLGMVVVHTAMETALALLNHLPLFALMLKLKDPKRLPGGVRFEWRERSDWKRMGGYIEASYAEMQVRTNSSRATYTRIPDALSDLDQPSSSLSLCRTCLSFLRLPLTNSPPTAF